MPSQRALIRDVLFVGATRPSMRFGVTYAALLGNAVVTLELFLLTKNLLTLLMALPVHGLCALLCARDPRIFDLLLLWVRTHGAARLANGRVWGGAAYSPMTLDLPDGRGRRKTLPARGY
jgi:type IV secretion system protein VirB3